jgi:hypothetical protein
MRRRLPPTPQKKGRKELWSEYVLSDTYLTSVSGNSEAQQER